MTHAPVRVIIQNIFNKEQNIKVINKRKPNWTIIGAVCIVVAFLFFSPFIGTICLAALMAFLWLPLYRKSTKYLPDNISSVIVYLISSLIIIIPIAVLSVSAFSQLVNFSKTLVGVNFDSQTFTRIINGSVVSNINSLLAPFGNNSLINADSLADFFNKLLPLTINQMTKGITNFLSNIPYLFTSVIVYTFIFLAILKHNESLQQYIRNISPFDEDISNKYINRSGLIVAASLRGQFIISLVTAISSALLIGIAFGMMQFFVLFVFVFTILGMVPLGSGIVVIPIIIIQMVYIIRFSSIFDYPSFYFFNKRFITII